MNRIDRMPNFLMPESGVMDFIRSLSKGGASRELAVVYDEADEVQAEQRAKPGSQAIRLRDGSLLARYFGVSRRAALYRLFQHLKQQEDSGASRALADFPAADAPEDKGKTRDEARRRLIQLALEANRREEITAGALAQPAAMAGREPAEYAALRL